MARESRTEEMLALGASAQNGLLGPNRFPGGGSHTQQHIMITWEDLKISVGQASLFTNDTKSPG